MRGADWSFKFRVSVTNLDKLLEAESLRRLETAELSNSRLESFFHGTGYRHMWVPTMFPAAGLPSNR